MVMILLVGVIFVILLFIELVMQNILDKKKQLENEKQFEINILEWFLKFFVKMNVKGKYF